jgi:hypothetical protein
MKQRSEVSGNCDSFPGFALHRLLFQCAFDGDFALQHPNV